MDHLGLVVITAAAEEENVRVRNVLRRERQFDRSTGYKVKH